MAVAQTGGFTLPNPVGEAEEHDFPAEYRPNLGDLLELDQDFPSVSVSLEQVIDLLLH